mmetsp:Transcript_43575/g.136717  ORF Transcript_43575/g.136717 Transcript_43575/m.136717 type:complete len:142 (+) Transcript_43575:180-605(+)
MAPKLLPLALAALGLVGNAVALRPQGARRSARRPLRMVMDPSTLSLAVDPATIAPILAGKMAQLSQIAGSGASPSAALGLNELELLLGAGLGGGLVGAGVGATASNEVRVPRRRIPRRRRRTRTPAPTRTRTRTRTRILRP